MTPPPRSTLVFLVGPLAACLTCVACAASAAGASGGGSLEPARAGLALSCSPPDAEVWVDGAPRGLCSDFGERASLLPLEPGLRRVAVLKAGYESWERLVDAGGTRVSLRVGLSGLPPERAGAAPAPP